jgi:hypothetical protein
MSAFTANSFQPVDGLLGITPPWAKAAEHDEKGGVAQEKLSFLGQISFAIPVMQATHETDLTPTRINVDP